ncbi:MAG: hypothetical protein AAFS06_18720 [Cyanobacteria bacterium J06631_12]
MAITYTNRKQKTYYLHQGKTKTGKPKYFFSLKAEGALVTTVPDGYEIYENPNAQVFLRKVPSKIILDDEISATEQGLAQFSEVQHFMIDAKKNVVSVFTPSQNVALISDLLMSTAAQFGRSQQDVDALLEQSLDYTTDLRFVLVDKQKRLFQAQRYCYLGRVDDWIDIGGVDQLGVLVERYVGHLGKESMFELH